MKSIVPDGVEHESLKKHSVKSILMRVQGDNTGLSRAPRLANQSKADGKGKMLGNIWSSAVKTSLQKKKQDQNAEGDPTLISTAPTVVNGKQNTKGKRASNLEPSNAMRQYGMPIHTHPTTIMEKEFHPETQAEDPESEFARWKKDSTTTNHGRNLILEEACRAAFSKDAENRSHLDLQSLKTWFLKTKLKTCTDFEALQPLELTLLCRRMKLATYYSNEVVFKQGDEGDALYIIFSGCVEVRVSQKVSGELVEVVVCDLHKGDFFGERSLLRDEPRAATIVTKTMTELASICRDDYNVMLKQDQQDYIDKAKVPITPSAINSHDTYVRILRKKPNLRTKIDVTTLTTYIETIKFFRALPKTFIRELCTVIELINIGPNTTIFREGEIGKLFYVIMSGSVDVKVNSVDRRGGKGQTKLINLIEGAHFGELALMKANGLRSATVVTTTSCELLIISEHDYNNILRKLQKEDMSKRLELLDKIPMFQSVDWTNELMEELCYVLVEQRYPAGTKIYTQGDKALQMYFITRGEFIINRSIIDPKTQVKHDIVIERLGPFNVLGDDAATGINFNEVIYRSDTATASTPIDALILTKYDIFNRLSRGARETLWSHTRQHKQPMVVMDQLYKTLKWRDFKRKIMSQELNVEKLDRRLRRLAPIPGPTHPMTLLESNDLILVHTPRKPQPSAMTVAKFTVDYNPDISTQDRDKLWNLALNNQASDIASQAEDGNPAIYLNYLHDKDDPTSNEDIKKIISEKDYFSENYLFSIPASPITPQPPSTMKMTPNPRVSKVLVPTEKVVTTEFKQQIIALNLAHQQLTPSAPRAAFRIVGMFQSQEDAAVAATIIEDYENRQIYKGLKAEHVVAYFTLESGKFILLPASMESLTSSYYCDQKLHDIIIRHTDWSHWRATRHTSLITEQGKPASPPSTAVAKAEKAQAILRDVCTNVKEIPLRKKTSNRPGPLHLHDVVDHHIPLAYRQSCSYAVVSILILSTSATEPVLAVHGCFPSEADALNFAEHGAMLCIVPMYEWVYIDDAAEWCISIRKSQDRQQAFEALKKEIASHHAHTGRSNLIATRPRKTPPWVHDREAAQKLQVLVASHMGLPQREQDPDKATEEEGYSVKTNLMLEQKLDAVQEILASQRLRASKLTLGKVQKIHKIGNMIKAKVAATREQGDQLQG
ncbi:hypothetical protein THRCLA_10242 [Thraustotheca clavata]|uniref:Cyclic nucleotide-binding domain-containing protein n=1 Tax=Thraustotheca clavata TaxID=74557 RepID=A0A1V9YSJ3_9STRA|nr:hypothetical protein THRCLA_10242 [Thraustotheca clavata]